MAYSTNGNTFPVQKLSRNKKTKEWGEKCVDAIIGRSSTGIVVNGQDRKERMKVAYELYNGNFDEKDFKHVTDPFRVGDSFPAKMQNYNIIRPKVDLLIGEESKRPFNYRIIQTNEEAISRIQEEYKKLYQQYLMEYIQTGQDDEEYLMQIQKHMKMNFKNTAESTAENLLIYLREKLMIINEFMKGWKDGLVAGEEIYYVGIVNGDPYVERVNPMYCDYDRDPELEFIHDSSWFRREFRMDASTAYDRWYDKLEEEDLDKLLKLTESGSAGSSTMTKSSKDPQSRGIIFTEKIPSDTGDLDIHDEITVYHTIWTSYKKVGFLTIADEEGNEEVIAIDEAYEKQPGDRIEWEWISEIWEGYRIGKDIYAGIQPVEYQHQSLEALYENKIPYTGVIYSNTNSRGKSLVEIMKPLQYMFLVLWYRLDIMLARDKGKVLVMDPTQIPKSMGIGVEKWMHYASALGIVFVNPHEDGWDTPGREGGKPAQFNQIASQDLSMSGVIADYIGLMVKIEDMIGEVSGVSKVRQGQIHQSSLVGNVQQEIIQSSHITEPLFWKHNQAKKVAYNMLLDVAKYAYSVNNKKKISFILSDTSRAIINITSEFLNADLGIFATDSTKENTDLERLRSLMGPAMQAGASLYEAAEIVTSDNISFIKRTLKEIDERKQAAEQQMQQSQQEVQLQAQQVQMQIAEQDAMLKQEDLRIKEEDSIRKAETAIAVAMIRDNGSETEEIDTEDNGLETMKLELQKDKQRADERLKERQLEEDRRKNRVAETQKEKEIAIKRKQANKPVTSKK